MCLAFTDWEETRCVCLCVCVSSQQSGSIAKSRKLLLNQDRKLYFFLTQFNLIAGYNKNLQRSFIYRWTGVLGNITVVRLVHNCSRFIPECEIRHAEDIKKLSKEITGHSMVQYIASFSYIHS